MPGRREPAGMAVWLCMPWRRSGRRQNPADRPDPAVGLCHVASGYGRDVTPALLDDNVVLPVHFHCGGVVIECPGFGLAAAGMNFVFRPAERKISLDHMMEQAVFRVRPCSASASGFSGCPGQLPEGGVSRRRNRIRSMSLQRVHRARLLLHGPGQQGVNMRIERVLNDILPW